MQRRSGQLIHLLYLVVKIFLTYKKPLNILHTTKRKFLSIATFTDAYLPTKTEMETIITNLWEDRSSQQWKIFSDGSFPSFDYDYYWTATAYDADSSKAYYASITTNYNGSYAGYVTSTKNKTETLKAIGVSYIK